ncbi:hypothetical protein RDI58_020100 [Solanum bulbocastanum]|uniref:SHSP domain-containing protein n=1 Tax=Solanum bulbocastanum TaxID=147425 RepID=A0AAN8Y7J9_SOLBU
MVLRLMGIDNTPLFHALHQMMEAAGDDSDKSVNVPSRNYVRDAKAMAATPADVKEYPNSGERKREEGAKYIRMERRVGKFMRKFSLPENANTDAISSDRYCSEVASS